MYMYMYVGGWVHMYMYMYVGGWVHMYIYVRIFYSINHNRMYIYVHADPQYTYEPEIRYIIIITL